MADPIPLRISRPARLIAGTLFLGLLGALAGRPALRLAAQDDPPKKVLEEEDKKDAPGKKVIIEEEDDKAPKRDSKVIPVDDDRPGKAPAGKQPPAPKGKPGQPTDLAVAAKEAKHAAVKLLYRELEVPHDLLRLKSRIRQDPTERIEPLTVYVGDDPKFKGSITVQPYDQKWKPTKEFRVNKEQVHSIKAYEELAQERVDAFLKEPYDRLPKDNPQYLSRADMLASAQLVLTTALRFHDSARSRGQRDGPEWDKVEDGLKQKLLNVKEQQLELLLANKDWDAATGLAREITDGYPAAEVHSRIAQKLADYVTQEFPRGGLTPEQVKQLQDRLRLLESLFPGSEALRHIDDNFKKQAEALFKRAQELVQNKENLKAIELLERALQISPGLPGLQDFYLTQKHIYPVLKVGVRSLPVDMAPGLAVTESERAAVELLLEGLVKASPEGVPGAAQPVGLRYEAALAEGRPRLVPLGRQFVIRRNALWSDGQPVQAQDVNLTIRLLRNPQVPGFTPALADLLDRVAVGSDNQSVNVVLKHGYLDPYSLMTFKVLPPGLSAKEYGEFSRKPWGSGPYVFRGHETIGKEQVAAFAANPYYASRAGKRGLPRIREIHFVQVFDPLRELQTAKLDLLLPDVVSDMTFADKGVLDKLRGSAGVKLEGPLPARRVWFLAVNHRKPILQVPELRKAIARAIPREKLLDDFFRPAQGDPSCKALRGPYPVDSWANDPNALPLDRPGQAVGKLPADLLQRLRSMDRLKLKYADDDPRIDAAMKYLCTQVQNAIGVEIEPARVDPHQLRDQVEVTHNYDLAYYHYDYPSEAYWLWPLFHPDGVANGRGNYLGYTNDGTLASLCRDVISHRDPAEVSKYAHLIHGHLNRTMPLIPLWQLSAYVAMRNDVDTGPLDPLLVFADVEQWARRRR